MSLTTETLVLDLGRALHRSGPPSHRLEQALVRGCERFGVERHFLSMPTALFASFGAPGAQRTFQVRVEPGAVDLATGLLLANVVLPARPDDALAEP